MRIAVIIVSALLWLWFLGAVITWKLGKFLLVEGVGVKSAEFMMLALFSAALGTCVFWTPVGRWVLAGVLTFWLVVQFFCHEYYTLFGASPKKLAGYNACFAGTVRLIPARKDRLVPDLYHIVLHPLIAGDLLLVILMP